MATVRHDLIDTLDEEERREVLHQILSLYAEAPAADRDEQIENLLTARGLLTYEDAEDEEGELL